MTTTDIAAAQPVQGTLFDVDTDRTDPQVGYCGPAVCQIAHITYRQLDYWTRTELVAASVTAAAGSGSQRLYSFRDILLIKIIKSLLDAGISLQNVRKALTHLTDRGVADLSGLTLMSDGTTVYECTSADEIVDLLSGGQGVFAVAVPGLVTELSGTITAFASQRSDTPAGFDELAARRAAKATA
ncbi:MerR family transcriptional regulator [Corynebacterium kalidii]